MISAKWDITSTCNLRCSHCSVAGMYFDGAPPPQLSLQDRLRIIDTLAEGGVTYLSLLGGEPLTLGDQLWPLLRRAQEHRIGVGIVTNGQLLDANVSAQLMDYELSNLSVSIESPKASVHNQIRGKRTFERLTGNLGTFLRMRGSMESPRLNVNTVLCKPNRDTFVYMIPFCRDLGVDHWNALTLNYLGNATQHLDNLAISEEEHTKVALEIGSLLGSPGFDIGKLKLNMNIVYPLVREYLCEKYDMQMPQPEICCSASISLVYVSPIGEIHVCDRVNSSGYTGSRLETEVMRPMSLLTNKFEDVWNSKQFIEMFEFVKRPETYAAFSPCNRCKYLFDGSCNPCPLQSYQSDVIRFEECMKAEAYLGDISRYDDKHRTPWEQMHQFERLPLLACHSSQEDQLWNMYPTPTLGTRHAVCSADGDALLMHPRSLEQLKLNAMGWEIWQAMTGQETTSEIFAKAGNLYQEVGKALNIEIDSGRCAAFSHEFVRPFIQMLHSKGFIDLKTAPLKQKGGGLSALGDRILQ